MATSKKLIVLSHKYGSEELYIQIPKELNWKENDTIIWEIQEDESIILKNTRITGQKPKHPYDIKAEEIQYYLNQEVYEDWTW